MATQPDIEGQWSSQRASDNLRKRHRGETILKSLGIAALAIAVTMLVILLWTLVGEGAKAFRQTHVTLTVPISAENVSADAPADGNYRAVFSGAVQESFPFLSEDELEIAEDILTSQARFQIRDAVVNDPSLIGQSTQIEVAASDPYDQLNKGVLSRAVVEGRSSRFSPEDVAVFEKIEDAGLISLPFNTALFLNADSRFPEAAGLKGALIGSFYTLLVCFLISFPVGIGAAIYLEEFAPKNRFSDLIEININNLAAVPSVVFGLLALAVFLGWFGMPRSAPLVGGMTLSLMTLPTIIIATRNALKAVPPSIREAALGVGASRQQVVFGHVLPLAMPGILTGTIIGLAQALGETAPLLLIGMNAFITAAPATPLDAATSLPTQIYIWADSPERGFVSRTSAAILVLLGFLVMMNAVAIFLRNKFERRW
ncbi:phosphate ABC transporter permease PstA [Paracoccus tegillarcae]|uniref:Phosphate transport system permease protein PstA n=1 Tax=Paracoccus tegillarcae TaxID=1529068 RepID=A0A2K9EDG5_9RHOB|nr:phosphate ABC transporter permease PstA [Paracoccus tegillarcae]AUH32970.1 phosphate ABC transporter, permease protein PstA [Paracoccus tegillarcae]